MDGSEGSYWSESWPMMERITSRAARTVWGVRRVRVERVDWTAPGKVGERKRTEGASEITSLRRWA
jgi:hypothetical protein